MEVKDLWMKMKTAVITFHNAKVIPNTIVNMERELRQKHRMRQNSIGKWFRFWCSVESQ